ncbi:MAG TPA: hypothetical protein DCY03_14340 [Planctomycetaceae bacterium]|nr:hypothetical protein [Planctomycetaceae bacterium]
MDDSIRDTTIIFSELMNQECDMQTLSCKTGMLLIVCKESVGSFEQWLISSGRKNESSHI